MGNSMASLNISLPRTLKDYVAKQVKAGGFSTPSEYVRALVRDDQKRHAEERLEALLLEGIDSGAPMKVTAEYWEKKRRQLMAKHRRKTGTQ